MSEVTTLIIGGTSGLGLELAKIYSHEKNSKVIVTGRKDPKIDFAEFYLFDLGQDDISKSIEKFVQDLPKIDRLIYAAGYYQEGRVTDLSEKEIETMINVCARALVYFVRSILQKQGDLKELITITSTSQWTPRKHEPVYNFAKSAAGHFSNSMAEDGRIEKVLVAGPAGMDTPFWEGIERDDLHKMLKPEWVAQQVKLQSEGDFGYKFVQILRQPQRVNVAETR